MTTGLIRIAECARRHPKMQFNNLVHHITPELLNSCLRNIPLRSSPGVDEMDVREARSSFNLWCPEMIKQIHQFGYRPAPVKRVHIPKPGKDEMRPIGIPTVQDRVLQRGVSKVLEQIYEQDFLDESFGGRPQRSAHHAVSLLIKQLGTGTRFVLEADLKNFFGSLDHDWMMRFLEHRVKDPRIVRLVKRWLKAGVMENGTMEQSTEGTPQGGSISVLLSNIYLHYVLDLWIEHRVKPGCRGQVKYVRYIDDFVLCFQYESDARNVLKALRIRLGKFSLELQEAKTRCVRFGRNQPPVKKGKGRETLYFLGFTLFVAKSHKTCKPYIGLKTEKSRFNRALSKLKLVLRKNMHAPIKEQHEKLVQVYRGINQYYCIYGNSRSMQNISYEIRKYWRKVLSRRSQNGRVNWEKYSKILKYHPIPRGKIVLPFSRIDSMANRFCKP